MSITRALAIFAVTGVIAGSLFMGIRAVQPPVPLARLEAVKPGMSHDDVRAVLGEPTQIFPSRTYTVNGASYRTRERWTYQRRLTFGYVNVMFDPSGAVNHAHYETF